MSPIVRPATHDDLDSVVAFCRSHPEGPLPLRGMSAADRQAHRLHNLQHAKNQTVLLAHRDGGLAGYCRMQTGMTDGITLDRQACLFDSASLSPETYQVLVQAALQTARDSGDAYLVAFLDAEDTARASVVLALGFRIESYRIAKIVDPPLTDNGREAREVYQTRLAETSDAMSMAFLSTLNSHLAIPAGRPADALEVRSRFMEVRLAMQAEEHTPTLIAETRSDDEAIGYLEVQLAVDESVSPDVIGYIRDFTVHPDHWSMASHLLQYDTEVQLQKRGIRILVGDISASNPRSLAASTRKAGFGVEAHRWGIKL